MNCYYSRLNQEALLHITGPDTLTFLQGQTSCDTRTIDESRAALGAYCTPQGRVVCDFLLLRLAPDHYALRMRRDIREAAATVFGKYIVFSKADLDAQRDDWCLVGLWGADASAVIEKTFGGLPNSSMGCLSGEDFVVVQTDEGGTSFECYLREDSARLSQLESCATASDEDHWRLLQISAGIARIESTTMEAFVPQVLNYDITGHINFTKGCYTGQEVVARLHYRGKSKRRTYLAATRQTASAGDALFSTESEQSIGDVLNVAKNVTNIVAAQEGDAESLVLVAATHTAAAAGLHLHSPTGPLLELQELPYSLESD